MPDWHTKKEWRSWIFDYCCDLVGEFYTRPIQEAPKLGDRGEAKKPEDNLRPEGEFYRQPVDSVMPGERRAPIKQSDNLFPEGLQCSWIVRKKWWSWRNLWTENLFLGKFYDKPKQEAPKKGDRADIKRPEDNLRPEGDFYRRPKEGAPVGEKRSPIKQHDNLYPEGKFYESPKKEAPQMDKRTPIRHDDNLYPEGKFYERPKEDAPLKGDRYTAKKPEDNLRPEGE